MTELPKCSSCVGSGEVPTDYGSMDCPDCGGAGYLPSHAVLVDWRARDLERALTRGSIPEPSDLRWMLAEMRKARSALTEIVALAHDVSDVSTDNTIAQRIRFVANRALGLWDVGSPKSGDQDHAKA